MDIHLSRDGVIMVSNNRSYMGWRFLQLTQTALA